MALAERPRQPWLAALLSFFVPGLGQAYLRRWVLAVLLVVPFLVVCCVGLAIWLIGLDALRRQIFSSPFLLGVFVLNAALLGWRLFAVAHAGLSGPDVDGTGSGSTGWRGRMDLGVVLLLVIATVAMHAYVAMLVLRLNTTLGEVFTEPDDRGGAAVGGEDDGDSDRSPVAAPDVEWDGRDRVNFLLIGVDDAPGRQASLTDTILVISVDIENNDAVLVSVPRDTGMIPLESDELYMSGLYPEKINQLAAEAAAAPEIWCPDMTVDNPLDARECGIRTLQESVSLYLGIPIHYHARIDFMGFERLIDALGGVELCLRGRLVDSQYHDPVTGQRGLILPAGCQSYDGASALAYARSRYGYIELPDGTREQQNDFLRAERQQAILLAVRDELDRANLLFELPSLLDAFGSLVTTDFPRSRAADLAALVPLVTGSGVERIVLGPPQFVDLPANPDANYLLIPRREAIREEMEDVFAKDRPLEGWYLGSTAERPTP
jgi:polyisoprenyl-teichoic acid--peptidoglycan teichoic acid transferase